MLAQCITVLHELEFVELLVGYLGIRKYLNRDNYLLQYSSCREIYTHPLVGLR